MARPGFGVEVTCETVDDAHALRASSEAAVREVVAKAKAEGIVTGEVEVEVQVQD